MLFGKSFFQRHTVGRIHAYMSVVAHTVLFSTPANVCWPSTCMCAAYGMHALGILTMVRSQFELQSSCTELAG